MRNQILFQSNVPSFIFFFFSEKMIMWDLQCTKISAGFLLSLFLFYSGKENVLGSCQIHTLRFVNDVTEGSTQEAHMYATPWVLPRKVGKMV